MIEEATPVICSVDISLLNDPARLRERAEALEAWNAGRPVDKFVDGKWIEIEEQTAFFFDRRYRARPPTPPEPVKPRESLTTDAADPDLHQTGPDGQNVKYLVLSEEERAKGFVRPVRTSYIHLKCGALTTMGLAISETYARDPSFYGATFCCACGTHFPLVLPDGKRAFVWDTDKTGVGE